MSTLFRATRILGHFYLAGQQDVLTGLGHGAIRRAHHQHRSVHLGGPGDHILDVVGVARAVHVGIVAGFRLIFHVSNGDGYAAGLFFGRIVDGVHVQVLGLTPVGEHLGDS